MALSLRDELTLMMLQAAACEPADDDDEGWTNDDSSPCPMCGIDMWSQRPDGELVCGVCGMPSE